MDTHTQRASLHEIQCGFKSKSDQFFLLYERHCMHESIKLNNEKGSSLRPYIETEGVDTYPVRE